MGCGRFRPGYTFRTPTGCGPGSLTVAFTDLCFGEVGLGIVNSATGQQTFDVLRNGAVQTQFTVDGGNSVRRLTATSAAHTYVVPTACAKPDQIDVSFTDTCTATSVTIANYGWLHPFLIQTSDGLADLHVIPIGKTKTIEVSGATITVSKTRSENPLLATHHHAKPAGCDALPVTGSSTLRLAAVGVLIVLLGQ